MDYQKEQDVLKEKLKKDIQIYLTVNADNPIIANVYVDGEIITVTGEILEKAKNQPLTKQDFIDNFNKNQTFNCKIDFTDFDNVFISKSQLNAFRRLVLETVEKSLTKKYKHCVVEKQINSHCFYILKQLPDIYYFHNTNVYFVYASF